MKFEVRTFERDLSALTRRLSEGEDRATREKLGVAKNRLIKLRREDRVKINHSVLELLCAKSLITKGLDVQLEHPLPDNLVCDVYGKDRDGTSLVVEIETGFVPPTYALRPSTYSSARVASKIARYSSHADRFALGTTPSNILRIPAFFQQPASHRFIEAALEVKALCDVLYKHPPITVDQIVHGRLDSVYIVDLDNAKVHEVPPDSYARVASSSLFEHSIA